VHISPFGHDFSKQILKFYALHIDQQRKFSSKHGDRLVLRCEKKHITRQFLQLSKELES